MEKKKLKGNLNSLHANTYDDDNILSLDFRINGIFVSVLPTYTFTYLHIFPKEILAGQDFMVELEVNSLILEENHKLEIYYFIYDYELFRQFRNQGISNEKKNN